MGHALRSCAENALVYLRANPAEMMGKCGRDKRAARVDISETSKRDRQREGETERQKETKRECVCHRQRQADKDRQTKTDRNH